MGRRPAGGGASKSAIPASKDGRDQGRQLFAARLVAQDSLRVENRPLSGSLVDTIRNAPIGKDVGARRHWPMQGQALLSVDDHQIVDSNRAEITRAPSNDGSKGGHGSKAVFIDER